MKKLTQEEFILKSNNIHKGKYDYSKVKYINNATKVCIICPTHGEFEQIPRNHLMGKGCPNCKREQLKKPIYGNYYNDYQGKMWDNDNKQMIQSYIAWRAMIRRCEDIGYKTKYPTYQKSKICDEWHYFSNFKEWFDKYYKESWHLDKDLLFKGNKLYSPNTCCFLPPEINAALTNNKKNRGKCLIGVSPYENGKFISTCHFKYLGISDNEYDLFLKYKQEKEIYLKQLADKWKGLISDEAYQALYNYKIEPTD